MTTKEIPKVTVWSPSCSCHWHHSFKRPLRRTTFLGQLFLYPETLRTPSLCCFCEQDVLHSLQPLPLTPGASLFKGNPVVFQVPPALSPPWNVALCNWTSKGSQRNLRSTSHKNIPRCINGNEEKHWLYACQSLITVWKESVMLLGS